MKQVLKLHINGEIYEIASSPNQTLLDTLREQLHLTGTKKGCNDGDCGACTVLIDGKPAASCTTLAFDTQGHKIVTIEGVSKGDLLHPVQQAFIDKFAIQCGFCTPGMVLTAVALLEETPNPTEDEIRDYMRGNLCRCTGYIKIIDAVNAAAEVLRGES
ncbi:MAG: (2Fe-2S)-binding protein [Clostridiales Family XIII bacterium]|jgi:carbon-monoxide dehydrogenase small subunit|nr:(2Fe-2S)-binding protein [Clostridiales Family XIII bacterium]